MLLILLETIMIRKFLLEDSLLKWVDNKNSSLKNGLESDLYPKPLLNHSTRDKTKIKSKDTTKTKRLNHKQNKSHKPNKKTLLNK